MPIKTCYINKICKPEENVVTPSCVTATFDEHLKASREQGVAKSHNSLHPKLIRHFVLEDSRGSELLFSCGNYSYLRLFEYFSHTFDLFISVLSILSLLNRVVALMMIMENKG